MSCIRLSWPLRTFSSCNISYFTHASFPYIHTVIQKNSCYTFSNNLLDLVPWQCSCRGTQRQHGYGSSPGVSVLGKMNRVVYSQAHVSTVAPNYIEPSFLWSPSSSWITILSHSAHVANVSKSSLLNPTVG